MSNTTFTGSEPILFNACVGNNGYVDYFTYAEGYSKAANLILDQVLDNDGNDVDSFIYPICFNMRHSVELRLKGAVEEINKLSVIKKQKIPSFDLAGSHDIGNIWAFFKKNSEFLDLRFKMINDLMEKTISDIADVDATGQTFRYPFDVDNNKHLTGQKIISCLVLKQKFEKLEGDLNNLKCLCDLLIEEYKLGSFTSKFSRCQIFNFVIELPLIDKWKIDLNKADLCSRYNLTSNDLTKILNFVKKNYEISAIIGIKQDLLVLKDSQIIELCKIWAVDFKPDFRELYTRKADVSSLSSKDVGRFDEMLLYVKKKSDVYEPLKKILTVDQVADLWALFYLSRDNFKYSEHYHFLYESHNKEIQRERNLIDSFDHVFSKSNFLEEIVKSLYFLQQIDLAEKIVEMHDLEPYFKFIPQARDRSLFNKPEILGYEV